MNKGILTVGIIIMAITALVMFNVITSWSRGDELDYYLVKETAEAAMEDAIDANFYKDSGQIRMDTEKFVETFLIRFAKGVDNTRDYTVRFYDLNEVPPKVSVKVESINSLKYDDTVQISTTYDGIVESSYKKDKYVVNSNKPKYNDN